MSTIPPPYARYLLRKFRELRYLIYGNNKRLEVSWTYRPELQRDYDAVAEVLIAFTPLFRTYRPELQRDYDSIRRAALTRSARLRTYRPELQRDYDASSDSLLLSCASGGTYRPELQRDYDVMRRKIYENRHASSNLQTWTTKGLWPGYVYVVKQAAYA